jgi:hypothetical protein
VAQLCVLCNVVHVRNRISLTLIEPASKALLECKFLGRFDLGAIGLRELVNVGPSSQPECRRLH